MAIAGATGFVGTALRTALVESHDVIGLTRSTRSSEDDRVTWRRCDLFRVAEVAGALDGCDVAVYLVHAMSPSSRLAQARFEDLDLLMADTFRRGAERAGVRRIVFLGGLIPPGETLSRHLASRLEVEDALGSGSIPLTAIRAGLIVGPGGSSFELMTNLVRRLPAMILPRWTRSRTQPVALRDVIRALREAIENDRWSGQRLDVGGPDVMTYKEMMRRTGEALGRRLPMVDVRAFSPRLSIAWVCLFGDAPRALVAPLVESLRHDMVVRPNPLQERLTPDLVPFDAVVRSALKEKEDAAPDGRARPSGRSPRHGGNRVRSVQRFRLPPETSAGWVAREYLRWLPGFVRPVLRLDRVEPGVVDLRLAGTRWRLLRLSLDREASERDRRVFRIAGGALVRKGGAPGRMEFRTTPAGDEILVAVHDYSPALPWVLYSVTQALAHLLIMRSFGRRLARRAVAVGG